MPEGELDASELLGAAEPSAALTARLGSAGAAAAEVGPADAPALASPPQPHRGSEKGSVEEFTPTSGRFIGPLGLVAVAVIAVGGLLNLGNGFPLPVVAGALLVGVVVWAAVLRPRIWMTEHDLVMRNMFETVTVPLVAIEDLVIRQVFAIRVGERRFVSAAVGRSFREVTRGRMEAIASRSRDHTNVNYADYVHDRVRARVDEECSRLRIKQRSAAQIALGKAVRRRPAWIEIALVVLTTALLVVSFFL